MLVFQPLENNNIDTLFGLIALGATGFLVFGIWAWRQKKNILAMLGLFGAVILGGNTVFSMVAKKYVTPISIFQDKMVTPYGEIPFETIKAVYIEGNRINPLTTEQNALPQKMLVLERYKANPILLGEKQYAIIEIKNALDQQLTNFRRE